MFPVVEHGRVLGCITVERLKDVPRDRWNNTTVGEVLDACSDKNTIPPDADAMELMTRMQSNGTSRMMVVQGERLVGIIAMKDVMRFLSLKMELGEEEPDAAQLSQQKQRQRNRTKHALSEQHG
jgi:predicted transcriptional regulator